METTTAGNKKLYIFDTTLRDGEQAAGAMMTVEEKLSIASILDKMGVDIIEAGFAISSNADFEAIGKIAKMVEGAQVCSLARTKKLDIERAASALQGCATSGRIHVFISTSDIHMKTMLGMSRQDVLDTTASSIALARNFTDNIEWSAQDATRTDPEFLYQCIELAIKSGATTINVPDTVGFAIPQEYAQLIVNIKNNVPNIDKAVISVHCQNDLGLATANTLAAVAAGACQVECTVNGIGERAGNTAIEEVIMAIKTRKDFFGIELPKINTRYISGLSGLVAQVTGFTVQKNKAVVGANAFAHESGIHQDGVLKNRQNYEIMNPEDIGLKADNIVLGKHSGRHAFRQKLSKIGLDKVSEEQFEQIFLNFKLLCDKKKQVTEADIYSLLKIEPAEQAFSFVSLSTSSDESSQKARAQVTLEIKGRQVTGSQDASGAVEAILGCIYNLIPVEHTLANYQVQSITGGADALGTAIVEVISRGKSYVCTSSETDILSASAKAYVGALNRVKEGEGQNDTPPV